MPKSTTTSRSGVARITYRRAMLKRVSDAVGVAATVVVGDGLAPETTAALEKEDYAALAGKYGDPVWGTPIEYDHVVIEHAGGRTEIEVFNRGIHIILQDSERFRRVFRVCEAARRACKGDSAT